MGTGKLMNSRTYSGTFPGLESSPGGEDNDGPGVGYPKGWCSERVPRSSYRSRRHVGPAALMPFSSGRTLPSKWEDAERWICSPVSLGNISTSSSYCYYAAGGGSRKGSHLAQYQRRAKSKSGPLGPSGPVFYSGGYSSFSPVLGVGVINGGRWRNSLAIESPGLVSARFEERLGMEGGVDAYGGRKSCPGDATWLDSWSGPPSPTQDELHLNEHLTEDVNNNLEQEQNNCNGDPGMDRTISRRDMATQMFPDSQSSSPSSAISSPKSSIAMTSPLPQLFKLPERDVQSPESEVRDVQVDKQASATRSGSGANYINIRESDHSITSNTSIIEADNKISKFQREEARINAWENLQKAKAEAAIQKLEEKLEKKRVSSMDKIIQKLQRAEIKAQKMRSSILSVDDHEPIIGAMSKTTSKFPSFCKKIRVNSSVRSCSTCYPF